MSKKEKNWKDSSPPWNKKKTDGFQRALGDWFLREGRDLPWRAERSVYRTVVSELMLQQTRMSTVLPYFERWMQTFPDFASLAKAEEEAVLKQWQGLGYYSRARNLHKLAKAWIVADPKPRNAEEWQKLPGIGPYTAAAISSIVFDEREAVVDGNVVRVLSRLLDDQNTYNSAAQAVDRYRPMAKALLSPESPGAHNEAMMELGALVCLVRSPLCTVCPVYQYCAAGRKGGAENLPRITRSAKVDRSIHRAWVIQSDKVLLRKHLPEERLAGLEELPEINQLPSQSWKVNDAPILTRKRGIGNENITEKIYEVIVGDARQKVEPPLVWVSIKDLPHRSLSGPHRRWIEALLHH